MEVVLVTPKKELFRGQAKAVSLRDKKGELQILPGHAPLLSVLSAGDIIIDTKSGSKEFKVSSGIVEVHENRITLLARNAEG